MSSLSRDGCKEPKSIRLNNNHTAMNEKKHDTNNVSCQWIYITQTIPNIDTQRHSPHLRR
jgi:hypothetical protein